MSGLAAILIALNSILALAMGVQTFRLVRREPGLVLSLISQLVLATGFSGWCWLLLAGVESLFLSGQPATTAVAWLLIESACLLAIEAQLFIVWRARSYLRLGLAILALLAVGSTLTGDGSHLVARFPILFWSFIAIAAIVELSAGIVLISGLLNIGRAK